MTFTVNGKKYVVEEVGIRMKGLSSRSNFYNDVFGVYNLINIRISFNQTFDDMSEYKTDAKVWNSKKERKERENRTFATLHSIELKWNMQADNTYVRNIYVNEVFRAYGIPTQKCSLTTLDLGGSRLGIYRLFEPVDEDFLHRNFPQEDWGGDLYKASGTQVTLANLLHDSTYGVSRKDKGEYYNYDLKTNMDTSHHESLRRLLDTVNRPDVTPEELENAVDINKLALFSAIDFAMGNMDDMRCNYNNHYVYFRKSDGKAVFIPYDCEIVLGIPVYDILQGKDLTQMSPWFDCNYRFENRQENPLLREVVVGNGCFTDQYTACLRELADSGWLDPKTYQAYYELYASHYSDKIISKYNFVNTMHKNLAFSLEGGDAYNGNTAVPVFLEKMRENIVTHLESKKNAGE